MTFQGFFPRLVSLLPYMHRSVFSQGHENCPPWTSGSLFVFSSSVPSMHILVSYPLAQAPHSCLLSLGRPPGFVLSRSTCLANESFWRWWVRVQLVLLSFISLLAGIIALCHLLFNFWEFLVYFIWFPRLDQNSSPCYSLMARSRSLFSYI